MKRTIEINLTDEFVFELPGQGQPKEYCQLEKWLGHRTFSGKWHAVKTTVDCGRFECPVCDGWSKTEALAILDRLQYFKEQTGRSIVHYVVSPRPQPVDSPGEYKKLRTNMYRIARKYGIRGGVAIFHYYRHPSILMPERTEIEPHNPHWHILGDGWIQEGALKNDDNFIVKRVGIRRSPAQIMSTAKYCLKWASKGNLLIGDSDSQKKTKIEIETWFGIMSLRSEIFKNFQKNDYTGRYCPICKEIIPKIQWHRIETLGDDPPSNSLELQEGQFKFLLFYE